MKPCKKCGGDKMPGTNSPYCAGCPAPGPAERMRLWRRDNRDYANAYARKWQRKYREQDPERYRLVALRSHHKDPARKLLIAARARAKKAGLAFNITREDIVVPEFCPVLGIKLVVGGGTGFQDASPTLDRVHNDQGYVKGNVAVISWRANRVKCDATRDEHLAIAEYMASYESLIVRKRTVSRDTSVPSQ